MPPSAGLAPVSPKLPHRHLPHLEKTSKSREGSLPHQALQPSQGGGRPCAASSPCLAGGHGETHPSPPPDPSMPPSGLARRTAAAPKLAALAKALGKGMGFLCAGVQCPGAPAEGDRKAQSETFPAPGFPPQGQPPTNSSAGSWKEGKMGRSLPPVAPKARAAACSLALERHPVSAQRCSALQLQCDPIR